MSLNSYREDIVELKEKGSDAQLGEFDQLKVDLVWSSAVDLDLMAFYKTSDGRTGGVYSSNYSGGNMGELNSFPYMQLSGDEGVGATGGDNRETMRITQLDDIEELYVCAVNFTDAKSGNTSVFANFDARVEVNTDRGDSMEIPLDSTDHGSVAILAEFTKGFMGAELSNKSEVLGFKQFKSKVPGAEELKLSSKITLKSKGDTEQMTGNKFLATLRWTAAVDLDLHCFFKRADDGSDKDKGFFGKVKDAVSGGGGNHIYYSSRGSRNGDPYIYLDEDAGVGDVGGDNEENIRFLKLDHIEHALIVANIFNKPNANFASYDGKVIIKGGGQEFEVPLTEKQTGSWCVIARIDNSGPRPRLINVNETVRSQPSVAEFAR